MTLFLWHAKKHKGSQVATTTTTSTATTMLQVHLSGSSISDRYVLTHIFLYYMNESKTPDLTNFTRYTIDHRFLSGDPQGVRGEGLGQRFSTDGSRPTNGS